MSKRRVTLTLDEDLIEALQQRSARSLSAAANASLRQAIESDNHRKAALAWLAELNAKYGEATPEEQAENEAFLTEIGFGNSGSNAAGAA
jgi:post-segregation antitoxin (ccd killing protein)